MLLGYSLRRRHLTEGQYDLPLGDGRADLFGNLRWTAPWNRVDGRMAFSVSRHTENDLPIQTRKLDPYILPRFRKRLLIIGSKAASVGGGADAVLQD